MRFKRLFIPLLLLGLLASGCASMRATHLAHLPAVSGARPAAVATMTKVEREERYQRERLTWTGVWVKRDGANVARQEMVERLRSQGAGDLADALQAAVPANANWQAEHGPTPEWAKVDPSKAVHGGVEAVADAMKGAKTVEEAGAVIVAAGVVGAAGGMATAGVSGTYVAADQWLRGIGSELDPRPCLEDVLEAYNQRLAFAYGLNEKDGRLVTCMPRWSGVSGREHGRASRLVRIAIGGGMGCLAVATGAALIQGPGRQEWVDTVGGIGLGSIVGGLIMGWSYAW